MKTNEKKTASVEVRSRYTALRLSYANPGPRGREHLCRSRPVSAKLEDEDEAFAGSWRGTKTKTGALVALVALIRPCPRNRMWAGVQKEISGDDWLTERHTRGIVRIIRHKTPPMHAPGFVHARLLVRLLLAPVLRTGDYLQPSTSAYQASKLPKGVKDKYTSLLLLCLGSIILLLLSFDEPQKLQALGSAHLPTLSAEMARIHPNRQRQRKEERRSLVQSWPTPIDLFLSIANLTLHTLRNSSSGHTLWCFQLFEMLEVTPLNFLYSSS
jgi:hypothetical protein